MGLEDENISQKIKAYNIKITKHSYVGNIPIFK